MRSYSAWRLCFEEQLEVSDLTHVKRLDGQPATFLRFYDPDEYIVTIDGEDRKICRDEWRRLPSHRCVTMATPPTATE
jgi:hypothetical protein